VSEHPNDEGILVALAERMVKERLPQALSLKDKVDRGEQLEDRDIDFLERVLKDARQVATLVDRHPEYQDIAGRLVGLYKEITDKALQNEQAQHK
jgi:predicted nucleotidyltransferase